MLSIVFAHPFPAEKTKTPQSSDYGVAMVDDTRLELVDAAAGGVHPRQSVRAMPGLELVDAAAGGVHPRRSVRAKPGLKWSQVRVRSYEQNKNSAVKRLRSCYGGRYKTRTCDLPHVKRMRYQLRQSSSSLSARDILYHKNRIVKIFLREHFAFCGAETAEGIIAGKAQIMTPETDGGRET